MRNAVRPGWWCLVLGLAHGALVTLAWPPMNLWWLAFIAPMPLVLAGEIVARSRGSARRHGLIAAMGSLPFWFLQTRWLIDVTAPGYPCLAIYLSLYVALFVALLARVRRARPSWPLWLVAPPLWVGLEVVRGEFVLTGYPWFLAAHPLVEFPVLASPAGAVGAYGVSLLLLLIASGLIDWLHTSRGAARGWRHPRTGVAAALLAWVVLGAAGRVGVDPAPRTVRAAVIQTNLPQSNKIGWGLPERIAAFAEWTAMTRDAARPGPDGRRPDVIVWPETMFPGDALNPEAVEAIGRAGLIWPASMLGPEAQAGLRCDAFALELQRLQGEIGVPLVIGALTIDNLRAVQRDAGKVGLEWDAKFNSALLIAGGEISPRRYDKHSLTPFGEVIPYAWRVPAIQQGLLSIGAGGMAFDLSWGTQEGPLTIPADAGPVRLAMPICFEVVRSGLCRRLVHAGDPALPVLLVNISNDGWFTDWPEGRAQHFQIARWRCVELGVPMIRAVNTGISGAIDASGAVLARGVPALDGSGTIDSHTPGVLILDVPTARASATPFSRWLGNTVGYGCLAAGAILTLAGRRPRAGRADSATRTTP